MRFYPILIQFRKKVENMFLYQPINGYRYNSDSIFLYDFITQFNPRGRLLDIGCGVGIISLLLGRDFGVEVTAVDKQKIAIEYAKRNYMLNGIDAKVYQMDITKELPDGEYDYIVSNPPFYAPSVQQSEDTSINISRYSHHMPIESLIVSVKKLLRPRGYFIFCYDAKQSDIVLEELRRAKLNPELLRCVHPKIDREAKIVMIAARKNSNSMLKISPPLVVFDKDSKYTDEAKGAFIKASTHSIKADI